LLDYISKAGLERLRIIENGRIQPSDSHFKLIKRLKILSEVEAVQHKIYSMFESVILMDHEHDWEIFRLLVLRKLATSDGLEKEIMRNFSKFVCVGVASSYVGGEGDKFADKKIDWLNTFSKTLGSIKGKTKNAYLLCDRDEYPINLIGSKNCAFVVKGCKPKFSKPLDKTGLLSWRRREVKHYLLSYTALPNSREDINQLLPDVYKLKENSNGDLGTDGRFNDSLASMSSDIVKNHLDEHINVDGKGFCVDKARLYINTMKREEISNDIKNLYRYLVAKDE
jgi:hypothetical protein